ncbi:MAG: molybdopterin-binding protein, partial [Poseidonia sp.]
METITSFPGRDGHVGDPVRLGIITVSDRASQGEYTDEGGPAILTFFQDAIQSPWTAIYRCVADERDAVEAALIELSDKEQCSVVVTTGGTGPASRDITPEATEAVCDRMMPGFGEQ